jgi:hypothetical protein
MIYTVRKSSTNVFSWQNQKYGGALTFQKGKMADTLNVKFSPYMRLMLCFGAPERLTAFGVRT